MNEQENSGRGSLRSRFSALELLPKILVSVASSLISAAILTGVAFLAHSIISPAPTPTSAAVTTTTSEAATVASSTTTAITQPPPTTATTDADISTPTLGEDLGVPHGANPTLTLTPDSGTTGTTVRALMSGFAPNEKLTLAFQGYLEGDYPTTDGSGSAQVDFTIPSNFANESVSVTVEADAEFGPDQAEESFTLTG
jgi:hypothetical protein